MDASRTLLSKGFLVPAIRYPTVARNSARLRITVTAAHPLEMIEHLVTASGLWRSPRIVRVTLNAEAGVGALGLVNGLPENSDNRLRAATAIRLRPLPTE